MNKKAQTSQFGIFTIMIVGFLFILFCAGLIYVSGILNDVFAEVGVANEVNAGSPTYVNLTQANNQIWGQHYQSIQSLRMVSFVYIFALAIGAIIVGFLERKYPFLFIIYILIVLLGILFAPMISNAYENLLSQGIFGGELANFTASNFIMLNLPIFVMVIGLLSSIGLFINLIRTGNTGEIR